MILKLVRRNIGANKGRLFLMLLSIVLGVSFVSGSFLLADSLRAVFNDISSQIFEGTDVQIRPVENELTSDTSQTVFSDDVFEKVQDLDGVEYAEAGLGAFEQVYTLDAEGQPNRPQGPPVLVNSWAGPSVVSPFQLVEGSPPGPGELAIDTAQARNAELAVGDAVFVSAPGLDEPESFTVASIISFGGIEGAYFIAFDLPTMQRLLDSDGLVNGIAINADNGVAASDLVASVSQAVNDPTLEVVEGTTLAAETSDEFGQFIDIIGNVLLGFAIVVLFVSIFIIYNTFAILISQRIRQFGLLRSVGATGRQLTRMVLIEALLIGVLASIIGLFGGIGIASALKWLFSLGGGEFPDGPLLFKTRTIVVVFVLGIGVTLLSAITPARLAQRIPALAALREGAAAGRQGTRTRRILIGGIVTAAGVALTLLGLFGTLDTTPRLAALGVGAALLFIGVAMISVLFASVAARALGAPAEAAFGLTGRLGRDNASRNPQRTAATATALMIGLALITGVMVLAQSLQVSFNKILDETVAADLFIFEENQGLPFAGSAVDQVRELPEIADAAGISNLKVRFNNEVIDIAGFDTATRDRVVDVQLTSGDYPIGDGVMVFDDHADEFGYKLGDTVDFEFEDDATESLQIVGIFSDNTLPASNWVVDRAVSSSHVEFDSVGWIGATFADGVDSATAQAATQQAISNFPQLSVQDNSEFKAGQEAQLNQVLYLIFGLLFLCIVVAFIGIVNTMALSVLERTREIGLLRAVGMSRRQLRSTVRWEAIIVGIFGALLGVVLGLVIGYAAVTAIPDSFISEVSIPWVWAIVFTIIGGLLGMLAAVLPARRAAKMNVLDAISTI